MNNILLWPNPTLGDNDLTIHDNLQSDDALLHFNSFLAEWCWKYLKKCFLYLFLCKNSPLIG